MIELNVLDKVSVGFKNAHAWGSAFFKGQPKYQTSKDEDGKIILPWAARYHMGK